MVPAKVTVSSNMRRRPSLSWVALRGLWQCGCVLLPLHSALMSPPFEHWVQVLGYQYKRDGVTVRDSSKGPLRCSMAGSLLEGLCEPERFSLEKIWL